MGCIAMENRSGVMKHVERRDAVALQQQTDQVQKVLQPNVQSRETQVDMLCCKVQVSVRSITTNHVEQMDCNEIYVAWRMHTDMRSFANMWRGGCIAMTDRKLVLQPKIAMHSY